MKNALKKILHIIFKKLFAEILMRPAPSGKIEKVLISAYTGLGHFVLKTALVKKIEQLYPGCKIYIIAGNPFGTEFVLHNHPALILKEDSSVLKKIVFFLKLRREKFDVVFLPIDASPKYLIRGSIIAGIPIRVGHIFKNTNIPPYYYTIRVPVKNRKIRSEIDINLDLLQALYQKDFPREYQPIIDVKDSTDYIEKHGLEKNKYICLQMSAANGQPAPKSWLEVRFRTLIQKLLSEHRDMKLVALGDKGDSHVVNRICAGIVSDRLKNLAGKTDLEEAKNLIFYCKFLICHDSGLLHIGNALKKDVIAIYGCSDPDYYTTNLSTCHIIRQKCDCSPCLGLFPGMYELTEAELALKCPVPECMKHISVDDVYLKCVELIDK
jgi:ADP-heptose:LPS heptosyltransferase